MLSTILAAAVIMSAEPTAQPLDLLKTFHTEFIAITPGQGEFPQSFVMGNQSEDEKKPATEIPAHKVTFDGSFSVAKYEVPQNLWQAVMGSNPSKWKGERNSVEMVTFDEAIAFCKKTTDLMRSAKLIQSDQVIRLPSEAEWEYVARAGTSTVYSFGDDVRKLDEFAWHTGNAAGNDPPVGAKQPNPWGLYDIHGYLWEWCADPWTENYQGAPVEGSPAKDGDDARRVLRGGSWKDKAPRLTSSYRRSAPRETKDDAVGLRCVLAKAKE